MKNVSVLRGTAAVALAALMTASPLTVRVFGISPHHALAKDGGSDDKGGDKGGRDEDRGGRDEDRGREAEHEDRGRETENEARGREAENEARGRAAEAEVRGRETETGDVRRAGREVMTDAGFANHGERVATFVAIAKELGYDANIGAQQANFGTPQERGVAPVERSADWQTANLDINRDGVVNAKDLDAAKALHR